MGAVRLMRKLRKPTLDAVVAARFECYVDRSAGPCACWPWVMGRDKDGYGNFVIYDAETRKTVMLRANRVAYALANGWPEGEEAILHTCDNPPCCNPLHLYEGDNAQNMKDKMIRQRAAKGSAHGYAVLTESDVAAIKREHGTDSQQAIARKYGVTQSTVSKIVLGNSWKHVKSD